jgi:peptidoglycan-N-acetylglucosamine deacetylase
VIEERASQDLSPWQWPEDRWRGVAERISAGRTLRPDAWPGDARVAVGLSFDSDHQSGTLREGGTGPGQLSQGEYGYRRGIPRIRELLAKYDIPATFFVPGVVALLYPDEQKMLAADGHELGLHGWIHERASSLSHAAERELIGRSVETLTTITGRRPVGMRAPSFDLSEHTLSIACEVGLLYDSSLMADDEPYEVLEGGAPIGLIEIPPSWIRNDGTYLNMERFTAYRPYTPLSAVLDVFKAEFDGAYRERGLFVLTLHPHITGHRSRMAMLDDLIGYIRSHEGVWFATHAQIADHCIAERERTRSSCGQSSP